MRRTITTILLVALGACTTNTTNDRDADADADSGPDAEADADADADTDSDGDLDTDGDGDSDADRDADGDADPDADGDADPDADGDADPDIDDGDRPDPCIDVTCSGHGVCVHDGTTATCWCNVGYHDEGLACLPDGPDGDADADVDLDTDIDGDGDPDGPVPCGRDCSSVPLHPICEIGDCTPEGRSTECCVAEDPTCHMVASVGDLYEDLEVDYRGFYDADHQCSMRVLESAGAQNLIFVAQTRGLACEFGFIRIQVRGRVGEIRLGTVYDLCDDARLPNLRVVVSAGEGVTVRNHHNTECVFPGAFRLTTLGARTGEPFAFELMGRLSELDASGRPTGTTLGISLASDGRIEVEL